MLAAMPQIHNMENSNQVDIRLHNLSQKERTERLPPFGKCLSFLAHLPVLKLLLVPFYVNPEDFANIHDRQRLGLESDHWSLEGKSE